MNTLELMAYALAAMVLLLLWLVNELARDFADHLRMHLEDEERIQAALERAQPKEAE